MTQPLPAVLYHGSAFLHKELKPGFERTRRVRRWDELENNHFLYASTDKEATIEQGFASSIEKKYGLDRFTSTDKKELRIDSPYPKLTMQKLSELKVYVYTIIPQPDQHWVKNNNPFNNILTEWKTERNIKEALTVEEINTAEWLKTQLVTIESSSHNRPPTFMRW
jgi:hypothetical protein